MNKGTSASIVPTTMKKSLSSTAAELLLYIPAAGDVEPITVDEVTVADTEGEGAADEDVTASVLIVNGLDETV